MELHGNSAIEKAKELTQIGKNGAKWESYYYDEKNKTYWVKDYPHGELMGGGSPRLYQVNENPVKNNQLPDK